MELFSEILAQYLSREDAQIIFPQLKLDAQQIVQMQCYRALQQIKQIIADDRLDDPTCFERIEQIVCVLEDMGTDGGSRHDFG